MTTLEYAEIKNFRSIQEIRINFHKNTSIVGQNSSGKSNILKALNAFFNYDQEREGFENGHNKYKSNPVPEVKVHLSNLPTSGGERWIGSDGCAELTAKFKKRAVEWRYRTLEGEGIQQGGFEELSNYLSFVFIPNKRDSQVAHDNNGLLKKALIEWRKSVQRDRWSSKLTNIQDEFKRSVLQKFEREYQRKSNVTDNNKKFILNYPNHLTHEILLDGVEILVHENGKTIPLEHSGSGTENIAIFSLYSQIAEMRNMKYVLAFEEPEQNLHPQAQHQLVQNLSTLDLQTIFTTHSPAIVDSLKHEDIILCKKINIPNSPERPFKTITHQVQPNFYTRNGINGHQYEKFHEQHKSDFIFSNFVLITESINDALVLRHYLSQNGIDTKQHGIDFVTLDGVNNATYFHHILSELDIPHLFIVDKDFFVGYKQINSTKIVQDINGQSFQVANSTSHKDSKGLPKYDYRSLKTSIAKSQLTPNQENELLLALENNYEESLAILKTINFIVMRYAFELDLISLEPAIRYLSNKYNINTGNKNSDLRKLLTTKNKVIKNSETLIDVLENTNNSSRPTSYRKIKKEVKKFIENN